MMEICRVHMLVLLSISMILSAVVHGWGKDGHLIICKIAQARLNKAATHFVKKVLPASAKTNLRHMCAWADYARFPYHWSSDLHFIDAPDHLCSYDHNRDCKNQKGVKERCLSGGINNYTSQLLTYHNNAPRYNLTEALLFLAHLVGDIHQPLHVGFPSDKGGNKINVTWFNRKTTLHAIWDKLIIEEVKKLYTNDVNKLIGALQHNISTIWANHVKTWETCCGNKITCPDLYASESIKLACEWAYKGVKQGSTLSGDYFQTRSPITNMRLAQAGVRLATLNKIFKS